MNVEARRLFGDCAAPGEVFARQDQLVELMSRVSETGEPVLGALDVLASDGPRRFRVSALALRDQDPIVYAVEFRKSEEDEFAALNERLRELNHEIVARQNAQAQVEEALLRNNTLYRELQHRVKNQLQMLLALVSVAGRESADPNQKLFVQGLHSKISALFDAQRLMYADTWAAGVQADQMLRSIADTVQSLNAAEVSVLIDADPVVIPNDTAFPLALIANELLTNAVKYGCSSLSSVVHLKLIRGDQTATLEVSDEGPGFDASNISRASSGVGLVRGLCRQIGARLDIRCEGGTSALVTFPLPEASHVAG